MALGPVMVGVAGVQLSDAEREMLRHPLIGGVILFTRNYADTEQLQALVADIHALREPPLLAAVDHEGGRVQRFRKGFVELPPVRELGRIHDRDAKRARHLAQMLGWLKAAGLRAVGIDELLPFERMIHFGLAAIMAAHVINPQVDPEPAGVSRFWMQEVLRKRLRFQGVIFSDDLGMSGAATAGDILDRARAALDAGCDMLLVCNELAAVPLLLDELQE